MYQQEDIFIKVIKYAVDKDGPFDLIEMYDNLGVTEDQKIMLNQQIRDGNLLAHQMVVHAFINRIKESGSISVWCSAEDRFRLLEYQELSEARESSLSASKMATKAIWISIISFVCSIGFSIYQAVNPIKLPEKYWLNQNKIIKIISSVNSNKEKEKTLVVSDKKI